VFARRLAQQAGARLAAGAWQGIGTPHTTGQVRAVIEAMQLRTGSFEHPRQLLAHADEIVFVEQAERDAGLVGDDKHGSSGTG